MAEPGTEAVVDKLPCCDLCRSLGATVVAHYDAATKMGPWAFLCEDHFAQYAYGLGTGRGQRLVVKGQTPENAPDGTYGGAREVDPDAAA